MIQTQTLTSNPLARGFKTTCSHCNMRGLCMPVGLSAVEIAMLDESISTRMKVRRHEYLFRKGDRCQSLYAIRTGFFKTCAATDHGQIQITGFQMAGEIIGFDGIGNDRYECDAIAIEDSIVCVVPLHNINRLSRDIPALQSGIQKIMSCEIIRNHDVMMMLGSMRSEQRVATFLLNLSHRLQLRGYSPFEFVLRMNRKDIGSYLGLTIETVSRIFSKFVAHGLIEVKLRQVRITDIAALSKMGHL